MATQDNSKFVIIPERGLKDHSKVNPDTCVSPQAFKIISHLEDILNIAQNYGNGSQVYLNDILIQSEEEYKLICEHRRLMKLTGEILSKNMADRLLNIQQSIFEIRNAGKEATQSDIKKVKTKKSFFKS